MKIYKPLEMPLTKEQAAIRLGYSLRSLERVTFQLEDVNAYRNGCAVATK